MQIAFETLPHSGTAPKGRQATTAAWSATKCHAVMHAGLAVGGHLHFPERAYASSRPSGGRGIVIAHTDALVHDHGSRALQTHGQGLGGCWSECRSRPRSVLAFVDKPLSPRFLLSAVVVTLTRGSLRKERVASPPRGRNRPWPRSGRPRCIRPDLPARPAAAAEHI